VLKVITAPVEMGVARKPDNKMPVSGAAGLLQV